MPINEDRKDDSPEKQILDVLVSKKLISPAEHQKALKEAATSSTSVVDYLLSKKLISEENIARVKGEMYDVPYIDVFDKRIPTDVLNLLSEDVAKNYQMVPFDKTGDEVKMAMVNPQDFKALEAIMFIARKEGFQVKYFIVSPAGFRHLATQYANLNVEVAEALEKNASADTDLRALEDVQVSDDVTRVLRSAPVIKMVSVILRHAVEGKASDIHIEPFDEGTRVRYRVDGILHTSLILPKNLHAAIVARIKVMANLKIDETRLPQDGRFRATILNRSIDCRISTLPLLGSEKVVIRILDTDQHVMALEELGFEGVNLRVLKQSITKPHGMILVTGPTGSGKSTTLYALLSLINKEGINIVTLEDPVEYYIQGVNQSQINTETGLTFSKGLRSILRQDPDVIMVGEIRDNETAELAVHASLTGHRVFSTLHTNDAFGAIPRLVDMKVEPFLIASSLNIVIAQRLVRRICEHCRESFHIPAQLEEDIWKDLSQVSGTSIPKDVHLTKPLTFFRGKGCSRCESTGYRGRIVIAEALDISEVVRRIILEKIDIHAMKKEFFRQGRLTIRQDGITKALQGTTTIEEVWNATKE